MYLTQPVADLHNFFFIECFTIGHCYEDNTYAMKQVIACIFFPLNMMLLKSLWQRENVS